MTTSIEFHIYSPISQVHRSALSRRNHILPPYLSLRILTPPRDSAVTTVSQSLLYTSSEPGKILALRNLFAAGDLPYPSLIFVQSIERADDLYRQLVLEVDGLRAGVVHGAKSNAQRDETVKAFREGRVWVLVVTEVMARGMDFGGVKVVINYGELKAGDWGWVDGWRWSWERIEWKSDGTRSRVVEWRGKDIWSTGRRRVRGE